VEHPGVVLAQFPWNRILEEVTADATGYVHPNGLLIEIALLGGKT
jgi:hypothetical protein